MTANKLGPVIGSLYVMTKLLKMTVVSLKVFAYTVTTYEQVNVMSLFGFVIKFWFANIQLYNFWTKRNTSTLIKYTVYNQ